MAILIKRYANRKLYNTEASRYITLKGIAELLDAGREVCVIDNETGEDITSVALSQILVDSKRSNTTLPDSILSQILGRGGDALYGALRKGMDEATDGIGDLQDRVRRMVGSDADPQGVRQAAAGNDSSEEEPQPRDRRSRGQQRDAGRASAGRSSDDHAARHGLTDWLSHAAPDFEQLVQNAVERVFRLLDLPRRSDIAALNQNLERVANAVETLEEVLAERNAQQLKNDSHPTP